MKSSTLKSIFYGCLSAVVSLALLVGWFYTRSTPDAIWLLFAACFAAFVTSASAQRKTAYIPIVLSLSFGSVWYLSRGTGDAIWALFICVLLVFRVLALLKPTPDSNPRQTTA